MEAATGRCPYCYDTMEVAKYSCTGCGVSVEGSFPVPRLLQLNTEQQQFIERFVITSGSLKEMAKEMGVSYPTVRNRLDRIIEALEGKISAEEEKRSSILDDLESGKITADKAAELIKGAK